MKLFLKYDSYAGIMKLVYSVAVGCPGFVALTA